MALASPRPLQLVNARHLDPDLLLITSTANPAPANRHNTHGKRRPSQTLASGVWLARMHSPARKKIRASSDLDQTVA
jgi:hypothetical protein